MDWLVCFLIGYIRISHTVQSDEKLAFFLFLLSTIKQVFMNFENFVFWIIGWRNWTHHQRKFRKEQNDITVECVFWNSMNLINYIIKNLWFVKPMFWVLWFNDFVSFVVSICWTLRWCSLFCVVKTKRDSLCFMEVLYLNLNRFACWIWCIVALWTLHVFCAHLKMVLKSFMSKPK